MQRHTQYQPCHWPKQWRWHVVLLLALIMHSALVSSSPSAAMRSQQASQAQQKMRLWGVGNGRNRPAMTSTVPKHIIVMGGPASGKGTQCQAIAEKYGLVHLSTGDMLRLAVSSQTVDSRTSSHISTIKKCMEDGKLIPDDIVVRLVLERLGCSDCQKHGYILDGFPRTAKQAQALQNAGIYPDLFLFLNVPDEVAIKRACGRRTDPLTGKIYHLDWNPPPNDVQQRLIVRSDDTVESMAKRLEQFRANASAVKGCYTNVVEIDGTGTPNDVRSDILSSIEPFAQRKPAM